MKFGGNGLNSEEMGQALFNFLYSNVFVFILSVNNLIFYIYLIGIFRIWQISKLECASNIFNTSLGIIFLFFLRIPISFKLFRNYFRERPKSDGLSKKEISKITPKKMDKNEELVCSICIEFLTKGQMYRELDCKGNHKFHSQCIEKWLMHKNQCPNCNQTAVER